MNELETHLLELSARLKTALAGYVGTPASPEVLDRVKASILDHLHVTTPHLTVTPDAVNRDILLVSFDEVHHEATIPADLVWNCYGPFVVNRLLAEGMTLEQADLELGNRTAVAKFHLNSILAETVKWPGGPND